jgi:hypothetical protein
MFIVTRHIRHVTEEGKPHSHSRGNFKSHIPVSVLLPAEFQASCFPSKLKIGLVRFFVLVSYKTWKRIPDNTLNLSSCIIPCTPDFRYWQRAQQEAAATETNRWATELSSVMITPFSRSQWPRGLGLRPLACWDCGFEPHRGHGCLSVVSVVSVVCCHVEVSATSWSLVQRSPTDWGASLCVI